LDGKASPVFDVQHVSHDITAGILANPALITFRQAEQAIVFNNAPPTSPQLPSFSVLRI
jgi:hypothetical protein